MSVIINGIEYVPRLNLRAPAELGTLGQSLKAMRKAQKLTLEGAAKRIGVSKTHIWALEQDKSEPGLLLAYRIADAYGVPLLTLALCALSTTGKEPGNA